MMHPLLRLIATQPQLLLDHAEAYADLLAEEIGHASSAWKLRTLLYAVALCCVVVATVLAGVALMLWAVVPFSEMHAPWALVVAPLLPIAGAICCLLIAHKETNQGFSNLRKQVKADMGMLREVSAS
ncbi:MAG: hypothetical protein ABIP34_20765 [Rhodoferax sp.]|uniref:hypothetical protein n=1 Tax=Rhodoferax sp. TaxID=50421 RepID=UPI00326356E9